jgi:hypothetical protein
MKKILTLISALAALGAHAQTDSARYYRWELMRMRRESDSTLRNSPEWLAAQRGLERAAGQRSRGGDYTGFTMFGGVMNTRLDALSQSLSSAGFTSMNENAFKYGVGISNRSRQVIFDFYFITGTADYKAKRGDESVKVSMGGVLQLDLGFNLLPSRSIAFYPYAGLSVRLATLRYSSPAVINPAYRNVSELVVNDRSFTATSSRIGYQAGFGLDLLLGENKMHSTNKVFFVKGGLSRAIGTERFRYADITIANPPQIGNWEVYAGIKFGNLR